MDTRPEGSEGLSFDAIGRKPEEEERKRERETLDVHGFFLMVASK
jgi:hypothetical protein